MERKGGLRITVAQPAGFCGGVRRAVRRAEEAAAQEGDVFTLGSLVHNRRVVDELARLGVTPVDRLDRVASGTVILRTHGAGPETFRAATERGLKVVDATCPYVRIAQERARRYAEAGYWVVVVGKAEHPEVQGVLAWAQGRGEVVADAREAAALPRRPKLAVLVQTTLQRDVFASALAVLRERGDDVVWEDTICSATVRRQRSAASLAGECDVVLVVGGKDSANTRHLAEICRTQGCPTYQVEGADQIDAEWFRPGQRVGITAGASTPAWIIKEVVGKMEEIDKELEGQAGEDATGHRSEEGREAEPSSTSVEATAAPSAEVSSGEEHPQPAAPEEAAAVSEEAMPEPEVTAAASEETVAASEEVVPELEVTAAASEETVAASEEAMPEPEVTAAASEETVAASEEVVPEPEVTAAASEETVAASEEAAPEPEGAAAAPEQTASGEGEAGAGASAPESAEEEAIDYGSTLMDLRPGQVVRGKVVQIGTDGVLVDVGYKTEGFVPLRELSYRQVESPADLVSLGDEFDVWVVSINGEEGTLRLSRRRAEEARNWGRLQELRRSGEIIEVPVVEAVKGGLVVDVGMRGFIPASQVELGYVQDLEKYVGLTLQVRVTEVDKSKRRVILSRKAVLEEERIRLREEIWSRLAESQVYSGVVKSLTTFGAFIDLGGVDGLLHVSEMSWGRVEHPSQVLDEGQAVEVMVLRLDRERGKISLGLKQVLPNPWDEIERKYRVGSTITGKVVRLAPFGAFVELEPGVDGLVHISQMADWRVERPEDVVAPGQEVLVKVLRVDPHERRISLSMRGVESQETPPDFEPEPEPPSTEVEPKPEPLDTETEPEAEPPSTETEPEPEAPNTETEPEPEATNTETEPEPEPPSTETELEPEAPSTETELEPEPPDEA